MSERCVEHSPLAETLRPRNREVTGVSVPRVSIHREEHVNVLSQRSRVFQDLIEDSKRWRKPGTRWVGRILHVDRYLAFMAVIRERGAFRAVLKSRGANEFDVVTIILKCAGCAMNADKRAAFSKPVKESGSSFVGNSNLTGRVCEEHEVDLVQFVGRGPCAYLLGGAGFARHLPEPRLETETMD